MDYKGKSSISYNSTNFLINKLNELKEKEWIEEWFFIRHKADTDEKKDHNHVFWIPVGRHSDIDFRKQFNQYIDDNGDIIKDSSGNNKPLGMMPIVKSISGHWILYGVHDEKYLLSKGERRNYKYKYEDIVCSNDDLKERVWREIGLHYEEYLEQNHINVRIVKDLFQNGYTPFQIIEKGFAPAHSVNVIEKLYKLYKEELFSIQKQKEIRENDKLIIKAYKNKEIDLFKAVETIKFNNDIESLSDLIQIVYNNFAKSRKEN